MAPNDLAGFETAPPMAQREAPKLAGEEELSSDSSSSSRAGVAEAFVMAGRAAEALSLVHAFSLEADRSAAAQLLRVRGTALAQLGHMEEAVAVLENALREARATSQQLEVARSLDALGRLHALDGNQRARHRERDAILRRLGLSGLPSPPLPALPGFAVS